MLTRTRATQAGGGSLGSELQYVMEGLNRRNQSYKTEDEAVADPDLKLLSSIFQASIKHRHQGGSRHRSQPAPRFDAALEIMSKEDVHKAPMVGRKHAEEEWPALLPCVHNMQAVGATICVRKNCYKGFGKVWIWDVPSS
jgi:hypothetical protein